MASGLSRACRTVEVCQNLPNLAAATGRMREGKARVSGAAGEVAAVWVDRDHSPAATTPTQEPIGVTIDRVGELGVHMLKNVRLVLGRALAALASARIALASSHRAWPKPPTQ